ncbi:MAG TPA: hypothetical protein VIG49_11435 [Acetobacteraceae bacterium]|jgi:hypothetical protein
MPGFDKQAFADHLKIHISKNPFGEGACARHVRLALAAAGVRPLHWPVAAKDWGPTLSAAGFRTVSTAGYHPKLADIAVMQTTSESRYGHIEGYNGSHWISDFVQRDFWPGPSFRHEKPPFEVYRWSA